ncbi:hypothetical protein HA464_12175 [Rhizobium leguminosarum bv. trifolii]|jgi:hypothetical protein|uniref:hypothetical protein n=1 Tax=Rhizobium ruizarguesonis TaxID=2081791 RepID=UPI0004624BD6|nr:hypothetical protein [Rhizobium ruizarguesonis]MBY5807671.1 hypothetical protein [Rhizobium leguminosarum]NKL31569.1 hypothetical protein [Rhizobium leguminosarum bv. viciae]QIO44668.1 hypothetical protein HA464_12175 [Rhizobium leguminosarum bv. trifolii]MBY5848195.1 hypothetical protein [Rhizobium leguminosarum]NEH88606.1 hypothetical protein [Rhizobium ruizarguesonis]
MDMTSPSGQLSGLSFLVFWVLLAILLFSGLRQSLSAGPKDDDRSSARDRSVGRIARYLLKDDRERRAAGLAVEAKARSYFARRMGKIHLAALAFFAVTTLLLAISNLHEAKMHRASQIQAASPSQQVK